MVRHAVTFRKSTVNGFLVPVAKLPKVKAQTLDLRDVYKAGVFISPERLQTAALTAHDTKGQ